MNGEENSVMSCVGLLVIGVVLSIVSAITHGLVMMKLWDWFIVPIFGVPVPTLALMIGFALLVGMFTSNRRDSGQDIFKDMSPLGTFAMISIREIIGPLVVLFLGWIVVQFV